MKCEVGELEEGFADCRRTATTRVWHLPREHHATCFHASIPGFHVDVCDTCAGILKKYHVDPQDEFSISFEVCTYPLRVERHQPPSAPSRTDQELYQKIQKVLFGGP